MVNLAKIEIIEVCSQPILMMILPLFFLYIKHFMFALFTFIQVIAVLFLIKVYCSIESRIKDGNWPKIFQKRHAFFPNISKSRRKEIRSRARVSHLSVVRESTGDDLTAHEGSMFHYINIPKGAELNDELIQKIFHEQGHKDRTFYTTVSSGPIIAYVALSNYFFASSYWAADPEFQSSLFASPLGVLFGIWM